MSAKPVEKIFRKGLQHHQAGRLPQASEAYQQVLAQVPGHPPSLHLLGVVALQIGQSAVAVDLISAAVDADPDVAAYHSDLGEALRSQNRLDDAAAAFRAAIRLDPQHAGAHSNLGMVRHVQGRLDDAIKLYRRALVLAPDQTETTLNLGVAYLDKGDVRNALLILERVASAAPSDSAVRLNLGNARLEADDLQGAEAEYRLGLLNAPDSAALYTSLGRALRAQGRVVEALSSDTKSLELQPDLAEARWNQGLDHLLLGDFCAGWEGFSWRWMARAVPPHGLSTPEWMGGDLSGSRLLIHAEQGLGDTLQFLRFLPNLAQFQPAELTLVCQAPLIPLLSQSELAATVRIIGPDDLLPAYDMRIALLDLPLRLGIDGEQLPGLSSYIRPLAERVDRWRRRLDCLGRPKKVGVVWKGRSDHANDRNRSMALGDLKPLFTTAGVTFVSLQKDVTPEERELLSSAAVVDISDELFDLIEASAAIECLDLVITVDTALAHLAGAMGKPVWVMLPFAPDWRWMLDRPDSPWYPTAQLFRQPQPGDWRSVVQNLATALS